MQIVQWDDKKDILKISKSFVGFTTEFVFVVNHGKGTFKLKSARKILDVGCFDIPKRTMNEFFPNIMNDAIESYIEYARELNADSVPQIVPQLRGTTNVPQGFNI